MSAAAILTLDYPPSANRLWRNVNGKTLKSAEYRSWLSAMAWHCAAQGEKPIEGPFTAHIMVNRPDERRRDIDNLTKPIMDALTASAAIKDDGLCQKLTIEWVRGQSCAVKVFLVSTLAR